jgi:hypothetical protein
MSCESSIGYLANMPVQRFKRIEASVAARFQVILTDLDGIAKGFEPGAIF